MPSTTGNPPVTIAAAPLGWRQWRIVAIASAGQIAGSLLATLVGIAIPMLALILHPGLKGWEQGLLGSMNLIGITIGSEIIGRLSDRYGYLFYFRLGPWIILAGSLLVILWPSTLMLGIGLLVMGLGIGGEYSLDADYVSELMPKDKRFTMVGVCKASCALGNIVGAAGGLLLIALCPRPQAWPWLMSITGALAVIMILSRVNFAQSPKWLMEHGRTKEADAALAKLLGPGITFSPEFKARAAADAAEASSKQKQGALPWRKVVLTGVPWACEGLGVYGIGVFIPMLVMSLGLTHASAEGLLKVEQSVRVTLWILCLIAVGFLAGLWLVKRKAGLVKLSSWGFALCAVALFVLLLSYTHGWAKWISLISFMAFELFLNAGPHLVTYVMPTRVYSVANRGAGSGTAAAIGKVGAVAGVFFVPVLLSHGGPQAVLWVSVAVMALGGLVTAMFGKAAEKQ